MGNIFFNRFLLVLIALAFPLLGQEPSIPVEELTWDIEDYVDDGDSTWTTARFETLRGAIYTLQSSPTLETWAPLQSFYALGEELHLTLFENAPPEESAPLDTGELVVAESRISISFHLVSTPDQTGTVVRWHSIDSDIDEPLITKALPATLVSGWNNDPLYFSAFDSHLIFITALPNQEAGVNFVETSELSTKDQAAWEALQLHFDTIQQEVTDQSAHPGPVARSASSGL